MKAFLDTEFTNFKNPNLISIGIVTDNQEHTFYAELSDNYNINECSKFVRGFVLPLLDAKGLEIIDGKNIYARMTKDECKSVLKSWFESINSNNIDIYSDAANFDWPLLAELLEGNWPKNLNKNCLSLHSEICTPTHKEKYKKYMMTQIVLSIEKHHALNDAVQLANAWTEIFSEK